MPSPTAELLGVTRGIWLFPFLDDTLALPVDGTDGRDDLRVVMLARSMQRTHPRPTDVADMPYRKAKGITFGKGQLSEGNVNAVLLTRELVIAGTPFEVTTANFEARLDKLIDEQEQYRIALVAPHRYYSSISIIGGASYGDEFGPGTEEWSQAVSFDWVQSADLLW